MTATATSSPPEFATLTPDGRLELNLHPGQTRAWDSEARVVAVLAGTQSGKTSFGPFWLWREIRQCGPGDYLVVTPTYKLLKRKALPELLRLFARWLDLGRYNTSDAVFEFSPEGAARMFGENHDPDVVTKVFFSHADDPESVESATAKAAWLDEAGQKKFRLGTWEAIYRRLSLAQGRILITTTPYNLGWLKTHVHDKARRDDSIEVVRFDSLHNPAFPEEEYYRAMRDLPRWKFDMFYRAVFTRPAGLIYDAFNEDRHTVPPFKIPEAWPRYIGLDFGGVNTAATFYAESPEGKLFLYRTYKDGNKTAEQHTRDILRGEPTPTMVRGGARSEGQWRREFRRAGLPVGTPSVKDVEVGIDRVYAYHATDRLFVFETLSDYLAEKQTYARVLDDEGEPTEKIEDKETFHLLDSERYILSSIGDGRPTAKSTHWS